MKNRGRSQKFRNYLRSELSKSIFQQQLYPLYYDNVNINFNFIIIYIICIII